MSAIGRRPVAVDSSDCRRRVDFARREVVRTSASVALCDFSTGLSRLRPPGPVNSLNNGESVLTRSPVPMHRTGPSPAYPSPGTDAMKARTLFSSALLLAAFVVLVMTSRSSSQEPSPLLDGFPVQQSLNAVLIDAPPEKPAIVPFNQPLQPILLPHESTTGNPINPVIGTLIFENKEGTRGTTPAFQFDSARPLVIEYMELQGRLAERLSDEQLETEIAALRQTLQVMDADDDLDDIRQSLQRLIKDHPDTPAADAAQRALQQLDAATPAQFGDSPFFPGGASKPAQD
jgi:hypothetical protein